MNHSIKYPLEKPDGRPVLITGPCSAETEEQVLNTAERLANSNIDVDLFRAGIWKPRTRPNHFEGVGSIGLDWLAKVKEQYGFRTTTEVANKQHVEAALKAGIDVLWIGARTTVNPFSVQEIADALRGTDIPVFIKNPINPDINLWKGAIERVFSAGIHQIGVVHRGFSQAGQTIYRNVPEWQIPIELKRTFPDIMLICDASHICGNRNNLYEVAQTSLDLNYDGIMLETHGNPEQAWSDSKQQVTPEVLKSMILDKLQIRDTGTENTAFHDNIEDLRNRIDAIDRELIQMLSNRMKIAEKIGRYKKVNNIAILQQDRWNEIIDAAMKQAGPLNLSQEFVTKWLQAVHQESINHQEKIISANPGFPNEG